MSSSFPLPDPTPSMPPFEYMMAKIGIWVGEIFMMILILWLLPKEVKELKVQYWEWKKKRSKSKENV